MSGERDLAQPDLVLLGGGEHGSVILDAARRSGRWNVVGFVDPNPDAPLAGEGVTRLGTDEAIGNFQAAGVIAVGGTTNPGVRAGIADRVRPSGGWATVIHPSAVVAQSATVAEGAVILAGAIVNPGARIGAHAIVNCGAVVEHDVQVGELAHIGPAAAIGGGTRIGARATVGLGARVRDHVNVGDDAVVGMGAVVVGDVEPSTTVVGVPARAMLAVK